MKYQSLRGMQDFGVNQTQIWQGIEKTLKDTSENYGFSEVRFPMLENTELFTRSTGESTDIIEKEMYTFMDKEGNSISLRPEGTAGCVRALIENAWVRGGMGRFYYLGSMFRYEKPQKGRFRQFNQFGVESFNNAGVDSDIEILLLSKNIFSQFKLLNKVKLTLNYLGSNQTRNLFKKALVNYLQPFKNSLDSDSQRRLETNPLRILDSKNQETQNILKNAPTISQFLNDEENKKFKEILNILDTLKVDYIINSSLMRGLDYYTGLVFEWIMDEEKAQNAVCSGGRYDALVSDLGGEQTSAIGFAIGLERLVDLIIEQGNPPAIKSIDYYVIWNGDDTYLKALEISEQLRTLNPQLKIVINKGKTNFKNQFGRANEFKSQYALVIGTNEVIQNQVTVKNLLTTEQKTYEVNAFLKSLTI